MKYTATKHDGKKVTVDFNEYIDCEFKDCEIIYKGGNPPVFENCRFENCQFSAIDRAENTIGYLSFLYQNMADTGAKAFVEEQIAKIKGS
ncbi:MAG: hypothetical protein LJE85_11090 [Gammaproteobacteria bacterium]|jgi:hypothetical protein|nr:hypothetical protein [Gammaproteobacteria bacterium]